MPEATTVTSKTPEQITAELEAGVNHYEIDDDLPELDTPAVDTEAQAAEAEASRKGWVPKDKYTGDPSKWVDAKTFIARGEKFTKNLQREIADLRAKLDSFEGTRKAFVKFHEETIAKKDAEIADAIQQLRIQRSAAVREGDDELAIQLEDRIDVLKDQRKEVKATPVEQKTPEISADEALKNPLIEDWIDDGNEWFRDDEKLRNYALELGKEIAAEGVKGRKFLDRVRERMEEEFPRRFKKDSAPAGGRADPVAGGTNARPSVGGKTEADLPPEDRKLMREFVAQGWMTKEKFLKEYRWS
ncbi:MAG: hypothetical protein KGM14_01565 [Actinomycetales bacterium]|nr:hypothetical protein [Actinomycetales bacterium]